jgi:hypothetical protein
MAFVRNGRGALQLASHSARTASAIHALSPPRLTALEFRVMHYLLHRFQGQQFVKRFWFFTLE